MSEIDFKQDLPRLLAQLNPGQPPLWGKMTAQHMVEHLIFTWRFSNGRLILEPFFEEAKLLRNKQFLYSPDPMPKHVPVPVLNGTLVPLEFDDIPKAVDGLVDEIDFFYEVFESTLEQVHLHPYFGMLNFHEWNLFHQKHSKHHLRQFGLL